MRGRGCKRGRQPRSETSLKVKWFSQYEAPAICNLGWAPSVSWSINTCIFDKCCYKNSPHAELALALLVGMSLPNEKCLLSYTKRKKQVAGLTTTAMKIAEKLWSRVRLLRSLGDARRHRSRPEHVLYLVHTQQRRAQ